MADHTKIEWADATANFINGCSVISPGCTNCYAMRLAGTRLKHFDSRAGLTDPSKAGPVWNGIVRPHWPALAEVLGWTRPRLIFWNAHGDIFHDGVPDEVIDCVYAAAALTPQHTHQILTKRSPRMRAYYEGLDRDGGIGRVARFAVAMGRIWKETGHHSCKPSRGVPWVGHPLPNVWVGVSTEDQQRWDERTADLRQINAAVRWISAGPLLGPIVDKEQMRGIDWLVVEGESGPGARPMHPQWARVLMRQCMAARVPFLFKQWGDWEEFTSDDLTLDGRAMPESAVVFEAAGHEGHAVNMWRVGKGKAGRYLDGRLHDEYPAR